MKVNIRLKNKVMAIITNTNFSFENISITHMDIVDFNFDCLNRQKVCHCD